MKSRMYNAEVAGCIDGATYLSAASMPIVSEVKVALGSTLISTLGRTCPVDSSKVL